MKFEARTAFALGLLIPVAETIRRSPGHWLVDSTTMLEDYLAGALLLLAARLSARSAKNAALWLVLAWSSVTAMMTLSLVKHVELTLRGAPLEPNSGLVVLVKFTGWVVCLISLVSSFRSASGASRRDHQN